MITRDNFGFLIQTIEPQTLMAELEKNHDFILIEAHFFNAGGFATVMSTDYSEELAKEAHSNGDLFCSKEELQMLVEELQANEY